MITETAANHWDDMYSRAIRSAWTQNAVVEREVYTKMTGHEGFWLEWVFTAAMPSVNRLLSIGCGDGGHEIAIAKRGFARHTTAFDASPVAIRQASKIAQTEHLPVEFSVKTFEEFVAHPPPKATFDAVLFSGSLHHVKDLEGMLSTVKEVLRPGGWIVVNEYVGPCYQLYPQAQVDVVNDVLKRIPPEFRAAPGEFLTLPTIDTIMATDPTEGVRSALIPILLPMYFKPEHVRMAGGALLHPLFGYLNSAKLNDGSRESEAITSMLIGLEDILTRAGVLSHDFLFGIYRRD